MFNGLIMFIELVELDQVLDITDRRSAHGSRMKVKGIRNSEVGNKE